MQNWSSTLFDLLSERHPSTMSWSDVPESLISHLSNAETLRPFYLSLPFPLFIQALSHRSFVNELRNHQVIASNERLEFLGDSILGLIVSEELYHRFPLEDEGTLSKRRGAMVNQDQLAESAASAKISLLALVGNAEWGRSQFLSPSILSDIFEALLGAFYLDQGPQRAKEFLHCCWNLVSESTGKNPFQGLAQFDPKSSLQEKAMALLGEFPSYIGHELPSENGASFQVDLHLLGEVQLSGVFDSKKRGSRELARQALTQLLVEKLALEKSRDNVVNKNAAFEIKSPQPNDHLQRD